MASVRLILMAISILAAAPSGAKELEPDFFQCDAPGGHFINHEIAPLEVDKPVAVHVRLHLERADPTWLAQAAIYFEAPQGRMRVQIGKADDDQDHVYVVLLNDATDDTAIVDQYPVNGEWIDVGLTLGSNGVVRVKSRINDIELDVGTTLPIKTQLHCHSGAFDMRVSRL